MLDNNAGNNKIFGITVLVTFMEGGRSFRVISVFKGFGGFCEFNGFGRRPVGFYRCFNIPQHTLAGVFRSQMVDLLLSQRHQLHSGQL
jgi:hypothetical protein